jgi:hypothetical protein
MEPGPAPRVPAPKVPAPRVLAPPLGSSRRRKLFRKRGRGSRVWRIANPGFQVLSPEQAKHLDDLQDSERVRNSIMSKGIRFKNEAAADAYKRGAPDIDIANGRTGSVLSAIKYLQGMGVLKEDPKYVAVYIF